jgi:hypothetical protein
MKTQLQQAITLIKTGNKQEGGRLLSQILEADPTNEKAWLWMIRAVSSDKKRIYCLERVLAINPNNQLAQQTLAKLKARNRTASATPTHTPAPTTSPSQPTKQVPTSRVAENVWLNLKGTLADKLVVLDTAGIITAKPSEEELQQIQAQVRHGQPLTDIPGNDVKGIPMETIVKAEAFQHTRSLAIRSKPKDKSENNTIFFDDAASRDDFFHALRAKLEPAFQYELKKYTPFQVMFSTTLFMVLVGFVTIFLYTFAVAVQTGATGMPRGGSALTKIIALIAYTLAKTLGPIGIAVIGGLIILLCIYWMVRSMKKPPVLMILTKQQK